jgi:hypothetical protein
MGTARLDIAVAKTAMATIWNEGRILAVLRTGANYCGRDFERSSWPLKERTKERWAT